jgi:hypothetical protein
VDYVRTSIEILLSMKLEKQHIKQIARNTSQSPVPQPKHLQGIPPAKKLTHLLIGTKGTMLIKNGHEKEFLTLSRFNNLLGQVAGGDTETLEDLGRPPVSASSAGSHIGGNPDEKREVRIGTGSSVSVKGGTAEKGLPESVEEQMQKYEA